MQIYCGTVETANLKKAAHSTKAELLTTEHGLTIPTSFSSHKKYEAFIS